MRFSYILQEFFRKLETHDSFLKIHMFMGTLRDLQNCTSQRLSPGSPPWAADQPWAWLPCACGLQPEMGRV